MIVKRTDMSRREIPPESVAQCFVQRVPIHFARRFVLIGLRTDDEHVIEVATDDPGRQTIINNLALTLSCEVRMVLVEAEAIQRAINAEELSVFLVARGHYLYDTGHLEEARQAYSVASRLMPQSQDYQGFLAEVEARLEIQRRGQRGITSNHQRLGRGTRP